MTKQLELFKQKADEEYKLYNTIKKQSLPRKKRKITLFPPKIIWVCPVCNNELKEENKTASIINYEYYKCNNCGYEDVDISGCTEA